MSRKKSSTEMKIIDRQVLDDLAAAARSNPRRRQHLNLHASYSEPCQRLLNALEPDSYIRPHRHLTPPKPESFLPLRGRFAVVLFQEDGTIERSVLLSADGGALAVDIPAGAWHSVFSLDSGSVFFETKPGPYEPLSDKDWAAWAPAEGTAAAVAYLRQTRALAVQW
ncbi:MAG: WbuC family cupin fold metalloprotein [Desulfuromonadales bacterium]